MIHVSLFLFLVGLVIYLFNANHSVFVPVVCWVLLSAVSYLAMSFMPMRRLDSPFYTPLTSITRIWWDMEKRVEEFVKGSSTDMDTRILNWLFKDQVNDSDRLRLLGCIPGFCESPLVDEGQLSDTIPDRSQLSSALKQFVLDTWWAYTSVSDERRRLVVCAQLADALRLPYMTRHIADAVCSPWDENARWPIEVGQKLRIPDSNTRKEIGLCAQCIVAGIISDAQEHDEGWIALSADQLGKSKGVIRGYLECAGDNVLLANLIHITRQFIHAALEDEQNRKMANGLTRVITSVSHFDIRNTLPGLQRDFLALWDEIDREAPNNSVLREIRGRLLDLYNALTHGTDDASIVTAPPAGDHGPSYPIYLIDNAVDGIYHRAYTTTPPPISHPNAVPVTIAPALFPVLSQITTDLANESSPGDPLYATQPITQVTLSPQSTLELESHVDFGDPQDVTSPITVTPGNIADTSYRDRSTLRPIPGSVPSGNVPWPTDAAKIPSVDIALGNTFGSSSPASTSAHSPPAAQLSFALDPSVTSTGPLGPHDDAQDLDDPSQVELSPETRQLGSSESSAEFPHR
jgi:hypothetical protein